MKYVRNMIAIAIITVSTFPAHAGPGQGGVVAPNSAVAVSQR